MTFFPPLQRHRGVRPALNADGVRSGCCRRVPLASEMGVRPSYVSPIEGGRHRPNRGFRAPRRRWSRRTGRDLASFCAYTPLRVDPQRRPRPPEQDVVVPPGSGLIVEREYRPQIPACTQSSIRGSAGTSITPARRWGATRVRISSTAIPATRADPLASPVSPLTLVRVGLRRVLAARLADAWQPDATTRTTTK